jgi:hypothetical protein
MTTTALALITEAMRLYGIIDVMESPTPQDVANVVITLNNLLRNEHADGAAQYLMGLQTVTLPPGVLGSVYSFSIGTAQSSYLVQQDAVGLKSLWMNDIQLTVNRETRQAPKADIVRTTYPGIITKWHTEKQVDGSILVYAWQPPRAASQALLEIGGRIPALTNSAGTDIVALPPEGIHDATLLLGLTICGSYGRPVDKIDPVLAARAKSVDDRWKQWARGQQWLRLVRA